jgi:hypothetical protein
MKQQPLVFQAPPPPNNGKSSQVVRLDAAVLREVTEIAQKCRLSISHVTTECVRYALQNVSVREVPLYDMFFPDDPSDT